MCQTWCKMLSVYFLIESDSNYLRERVSCHRIEAKKKKWSLCRCQGDPFLSLDAGCKDSVFSFHWNHYYLAWLSSETFENLLEHSEVSCLRGSRV